MNTFNDQPIQQGAVQMAYKDVPMKPVMRHWICDCGGEMIAQGGTLLTSPPQYRHECKSCARVKTTFNRYPSIVYVPE